jgi:hypothetical protein
LCTSIAFCWEKWLKKERKINMRLGKNKTIVELPCPYCRKMRAFDIASLPEMKEWAIYCQNCGNHSQINQWEKGVSLFQCKTLHRSNSCHLNHAQNVASLSPSQEDAGYVINVGTPTA